MCGYLYFLQSFRMSSSSFREAFAAVLSDLILATHCHSCGGEYHVSLRGYCGVHCSKSCWKYNEYYPSISEELYEETGEVLEEGGFTCPFGGCKHCVEGTRVGLALTARHSGGSVWPMMPKKPCTNECIKTRRPVART